MKIIYGKDEKLVQQQLFINYYDYQLITFDCKKQLDEIYCVLFQDSLLNNDERQVYVINHLNELNSDALKTFLKKVLSCNKNIVGTYVSANQDVLFERFFYANKIELINANRVGAKNIQQFAFDLLKVYPINFDCETTKNLFLDLCKDNPHLIYHEIIKFHNYGLSKVVDANVVNDLAYHLPDDNVFNLISLILSGEVKQALTLFNTLLSLKRANVTSLIAAISYSIFNLKLLKEAQQVYHTAHPNTLGNLFNMHPYIIQHHLNLISTVSLQTLNKMLNYLLNIDYNIKTYSLLDEVAFKEFILKDWEHGK